MEQNCHDSSGGGGGGGPLPIANGGVPFPPEK